MHILEQLYQIIHERKSSDPAESYVASLYHKGSEKIAQKVGEEAVETVIEAIKNNPEKLKEESADLLFHLMVLWADKDILPEDVFSILKQRLGKGGLDEKRERAN